MRNDAARQLRAGRSRSIGMVVLDAGNPFFAAVARGAEARAVQDGLSVLLGNSDEDPDRESTYLDLFREQRVNGVLLTPAGVTTEAMLHLSRDGIPVVLVDHEDEDSSSCSVAVDDVEGGQLAARHLLEQGRRKLLFSWAGRRRSLRCRTAWRALVVPWTTCRTPLSKWSKCPR